MSDPILRHCAENPPLCTRSAPAVFTASRRNDSHPARGGRRDAGSVRVWAAGAGLPGWRLVSEPLPPDTAAEFAACLRACGYRTLAG